MQGSCLQSQDLASWTCIALPATVLVASSVIAPTLNSTRRRRKWLPLTAHLDFHQPKRSESAAMQSVVLAAGDGKRLIRQVAQFDGHAVPAADHVIKCIHGDRKWRRSDPKTRQVVETPFVVVVSLVLAPASGMDISHDLPVDVDGLPGLFDSAVDTLHLQAVFEPAHSQSLVSVLDGQQHPRNGIGPSDRSAVERYGQAGGNLSSGGPRFLRAVSRRRRTASVGCRADGHRYRAHCQCSRC